MLGTNNPFYGKKHSEETLVKIREAAKKRFSKPEDNPMFGVKRSKAFCKRLSKIQKELQVSKKYWAKLKLDPVAYQEAIAKKSLLHKGMKHSEATKKILREKAAIRNRRPGFKKIVSDNTKAQWERLRADPAAYAERNRRTSVGHKGLAAGNKNPRFGKSPVYPVPFRVVGLQHRIRSSYEAIFFKFLQDHQIEYTYESKRFAFELNGVKRNYWTDGHILGTNIWIEVKGWCDPLSIIKMKEFRRLYPENKLFVITIKSNIKNVPPECYDKVFDLKNLEPILDEIKQAKVVPV